MRQSKFLFSYLEENADRIARGDGPITIGTFLTQRLRGRAAKYGVNYGKSLERSCRATGAIGVESKGGGVAWVRLADAIILRDKKFVQELETRSMSTWTDEETRRYNHLTGQEGK